MSIPREDLATMLRATADSVPMMTDADSYALVQLLIAAFGLRTGRMTADEFLGAVDEFITISQTPDWSKVLQEGKYIQ